ncbi:XdhC family protein, partial [Kineococcus glutinatus]|uniref:XdhC family protein n=1 Tax=Kineococcus glutinatus TaxID=1070872 RepID=UPI0031EAE6EF
VVLGVVTGAPPGVAPEVGVGSRFLLAPTAPAGTPAAPAAVAAGAAALLAAREAVSVVRGGWRACLVPLSPPQRLLVFGSVDVAAAAAHLGELLGFRVTVCDARAALTTPARFPGVRDLVVERPDRYLARERDAGRLGRAPVLLVLTHDPRFDLPLLRTALRLPDVGYLGAMGSRRTHADRAARLAAAGLAGAAAGRVRGPLGLDLRGATPAETALSVLAEVVAVLRGGTGLPLSATTGPIHAPRAAGDTPGGAPARGSGDAPACTGDAAWRGVV